VQPELLFGIHSVLAALERHPERIAGVWLDARRRDGALQEIRAAAHARGIAVHEVARRDLEQMQPGGHHQGVVARVAAAAGLGEGDLPALLAGLGQPAFLLVLDGVQDPHNLGACLRSADAAGVQAVIVPKDRAVGLTATVRKVASGAAESVPLVTVTNLARTLEQLQQAGIWLVGLAGEAEQSLYELDLTGPLALVLGGEGKGLRRLTRERCDFLGRLPMAGSVESLNVSVAAGVALFEAVRQRGVVGGPPAA